MRKWASEGSHIGLAATVAEAARALLNGPKVLKLPECCQSWVVCLRAWSRIVMCQAWPDEAELKSQDDVVEAAPEDKATGMDRARRNFTCRAMGQGLIRMAGINYPFMIFHVCCSWVLGIGLLLQPKDLVRFGSLPAWDVQRHRYHGCHPVPRRPRAPRGSWAQRARRSRRCP